MCGLHVGEVVSGSWADASGRALRLEDLFWSDQEMTLIIRLSKTNQRGVRQRVTIARVPHLPCPYATMQEYLRIRPQGQAASFVHEDGSLLTKF